MAHSSPRQLTPTSAGLLSGIRRFEPESWSRLVRIYGPMVAHWCRIDGLQDSDADDVTQRVFLSIHQSVERFQRTGRPGAFKAWLKTITRNKVIDFWRSKDHAVKGVGGSDFQNQMTQMPDVPKFIDSDAKRHDGAEDGMLTKLALKVIQDEFRESSWQAFWLTAVEGQNSTAVAAELNTTPAAVRKAKSRVLRRLKEVLEAPI